MTHSDLDTHQNNDDEIELDGSNDEIKIVVPFDPNKIKVNTKPYSIGQIVSDLRDGVIDFDTEFQRLPGLWNGQKKSRFIESLLLNLPVPAFYFNEKEENNWEVVDGLQRVSTIKQFVVDNNLSLENLEFLNEYNDKTYNELPITLQKRITRFSITLYLIEKGTPDDVKFNLFKRINQGGLVLTPQEIRHAINQGKPAELIADLVRGLDVRDDEGNVRMRRNRDGSKTTLTATPEGLAFIEATGYKIKSLRMEDRDFAARFIAFALIPVDEYEPDMDSFLNKGMGKIKELSLPEIEVLKSSFKDAMNAAFSLFGIYAFRKMLYKDVHRMPINKALFEVLSVTLAKLSPSQIVELQEKKDKLIDGFIALNHDPRFIASISQGTAQKENVEKRFGFIQKLLTDTLNLPANA